MTRKVWSLRKHWSRHALPCVLLLGMVFGSRLVVSRFSVGQFDPRTYIISGAIFLGKQITLTMLGGMAIIFTGLTLLNWQEVRRMVVATRRQRCLFLSQVVGEERVGEQERVRFRPLSSSPTL